MKHFICIALFLIVSCSTQFKLDHIFKQMEHRAEKERILEYKNLTLDDAITNYPKYEDVFTTAASFVLKDSINNRVYSKFVRQHKLDNSGVSTGRVVGALFHCWQNNKEIDVVKLRHRVEELGYGFPQE